MTRECAISIFRGLWVALSVALLGGCHQGEHKFRDLDGYQMCAYFREMHEEGIVLSRSDRLSLRHRLYELWSSSDVDEMTKVVAKLAQYPGDLSSMSSVGHNLRNWLDDHIAFSKSGLSTPERMKSTAFIERLTNLEYSQYPGADWLRMHLKGQ